MPSFLIDAQIWATWRLQREHNYYLCVTFFLRYFAWIVYRLQSKRMFNLPTKTDLQRIMVLLTSLT